MSRDLAVKTTTNLMEALNSCGLTITKVEKIKPNFLPYAYLNLKEAQDKYKLIVIDGDIRTVIDRPYIMIPMTVRQMYRKLEGQKYTTRVYDTGSTADTYNSLKTWDGAGWQEGCCMIVAILMDNFAKVVKIEACGSSKNYWLNPLSVCDLSKGVAVKINDISHANNLKTTSKGSYLCVHKFKNYTSIMLSAVQTQQLQATIREQEEQIKSFMNM